MIKTMALKGPPQVLIKSQLTFRGRSVVGHLDRAAYVSDLTLAEDYAETATCNKELCRSRIRISIASRGSPERSEEHRISPFRGPTVRPEMNHPLYEHS